MGQQAIHKFVLGAKEVEGKNAEFQYDRGTYSIVQINGEERETLYKSRNAQEAYLKWNIYIGRKKERPVREHEQSDGEYRERRSRSRQESNTRRDSRRGIERRDGADSRRNTERRDGADSRRNTDRRDGADSRRNTERRDVTDSRRNTERRDGTDSRRDGRSRKRSNYTKTENAGTAAKTRERNSSGGGEDTAAKNRTDYRKKSDTHSQLEKRKAKARKDWARRRRGEESLDEV